MPKQKQRTLLEYLGSSSPAKRSSPRKEPSLMIESDDSASDPGRIKFEREVPRSSADQDDTVDRNDTKPRRSARILATRSDASLSASSSRSTSSERVVPSRKLSDVRNKRLVLTSDESDDHGSPKRRRLVKGKRPGSPSEDVEDEDLADEVDEARILTSRLRDRSKKTDFSRNLERLQRRRRGQISPSENEDSDNDDSESSFSRDKSLFKGARPSVHEEGDTAEDVLLDDDDDDFIIQDDGNEMPELPTAFSMGTYQDLSHHFKVICQFFVHLAVKAPRKRRTFMEMEMKSSYFSTPFALARRKLSAMKDSLVTSSVWNTDFKVSLESFPDFRLESLEFSIPLCDACRLGSRVATLRGIIGGQKYDRLTFELLEEKTPEFEERESGEIEWNLGRYCAARTQVFHSFSHWEYTLYHSLRKEVECLQDALTLSDDERAFLPITQGSSPPDDPNDADGIMEWLDGRGIINMQWIKMKNMIDRAQKLENVRQTEECIDVT